MIHDYVYVINVLIIIIRAASETLLYEFRPRVVMLDSDKQSRDAMISTTTTHTTTTTTTTTTTVTTTTILL